MARPTYCMVMIALASALAVGSCGRGDAAGTEAVALVNGDRITADYLRSMLDAEASEKRQPDEARQLAADTLEQLIDRELLVQQAYQAKLDRDPRVNRVIENTRRQILAQAYVERMAVAAANGTGEDVQAFYLAHPELFAQRKIYRLTEISVAMAADQAPLLHDRAAAARSIDEVFQWLKARNISFTSGTHAKPAERLPMEYLARISGMKDGEIGVFPATGGAWVVQVLGLEAAPVSEQAARPVIERYLSGRRKSEIAAAEISRLRKRASIEYAGDFKQSSAAPWADAMERRLAEGVKQGVPGL